MGNVIVTENGFAPDAWRHGFVGPEALPALARAATNGLAVDLEPEADPEPLSPLLDSIDMIRIRFASFGDGRGFSLARRLREEGFPGRLRARGALLPDQLAQLLCCGFDEVEITPERGARQPEADWLAALACGPAPDLQRLRQYARWQALADMNNCTNA